MGANHKCLSLLTWPQKVLPLTHTNWILSTEIIFWLIKLWLRKWLRELTSKIDFLSMQWYGLLQKTEFKEWLSTMPAFNVNLHIIQWFLCFNLSMQEKGYLKFKNLAVYNFLMNGLGLASLELGFLHWHGVPACQQILPPCLRHFLLEECLFFHILILLVIFLTMFSKCKSPSLI